MGLIENRTDKVKTEKRIVTAVAFLALMLMASLASCTEREAGTVTAVTIDGQTLAFTPVKDQGSNETCWAYAMLATIEANHLAQGDSVHLSVGYAVRHLIEDHYRRYVLSGGKTTFTTRAAAQTLLNIIERHGIVPHSAYDGYDNVDTRVIANKVRRIAQTAVNMKSGQEKHLVTVRKVLDESLGHVPAGVRMLGADYTPQEFARSVCSPGEYQALTSFTHHPFYEHFALEVPDNWEQNLFYNLPLDSLVGRINAALARGEAVCWEGDISEEGFDWHNAMADLDGEQYAGDEQLERQRLFESYQTTDDHAMCIIGTAPDSNGRTLYILKNSWGTGNAMAGLMYMTADYLKMKTIAVWLKVK